MDYIRIFFTLTIISTKSTADSTEDDQHFSTYTYPFAPSTINFQDFYTNNFHKYSDDSKTSPVDEEFLLNNIPTQFVEFHPSVHKISRITPPPRVVLNSSQVKKNLKEHDYTVVNESTEDPEVPIKVIPLRNYQRGVLDLLFPAARVRSFKGVFDSIRRLLSYTFRKR